MYRNTYVNINLDNIEHNVRKFIKDNDKYKYYFGVVKADSYGHYDNHKTYIKSWIEILEDKPNELFKAINESNKVCDYINNKIQNKLKENAR